MQNQHELRLLEKCEKLEKELILKNRELEIEAALERIRSRSMAMHKSDELMEVIQLVYEQLERLNIKIDSTNFCLNYKESDDITLWTAIPERPYPTKFYIPYFDHPWFVRFKEAKTKGLQFTADRYSFEEKNRFWMHFFEHAPAVTEERKKYILSCPGLTMSMVYMNTISLLITNYEGIPFTDKENEVFMRIGNVFEQTYTRFLDLQKAEAQAREAQIEAALERVRSRSLAMHRSDELEQVAARLFEAIVGLGIAMDGALLFVFDREKRNITLWVTIVQLTKPVLIELPYEEEMKDNEIILDYWKATDQGLALSKVYTGEAKNEYFRYVQRHNSAKISEQTKNHLIDLPAWHLSFAAEKNTMLGLDSWSGHLFTESDLNMLRKFVKAFEQAYVRFLDLQKAEAQARESQIQLSLERIRAKAMSMQHSDELSDFLTVLFEQFEVLNLRPVNCILSLFDIENNRSTFRMTGKKGSTLIASQEIDLDASPVWKQKVENWKSGHPNDVDVLYIPYENLPEIAEIFKEILEKLPEDERPLPEDYPNGEYIIDGYCKYGYLGYAGSGPPSEEEKEITRRIANEFGNVYQRFLDLQKAEAQAREAEIQLALERVRARSLAMHRSEELANISMELVKQVQTLGMESWFCAFNIYDDDPLGSVEWGSNGQGTFPQYRTPREGVFLRYFEAGQRGETLLVNEIGEEECPAHYEYLCSLPGVGEQLLQMKAAGIPFPSSQIDHVAFFKYGYVLFITYEPAPESHDIFKRFANLFEQSYTRFLDLQKAEAQAREAQIENALEKVRSRTMAMQTSDELTDVAGLLFDQVCALGIKTWTTGFNVWSEDNNSYVDYLNFGEGFIEPNTVHTEKAEALKDVSNARKSGVEFEVLYVEGEKIKQLYLAISGIDEKEYDIMVKDGLLPSQQYEHFVFGAKVSVMFITYEPVPEAHDIFKRLGKVFEQTYTRFLDLQKAEAQAQEAIKRASVDRVRAEIASMRTKGDLERIQPLIWNELKILRVPFIRCGVFIMDEVKQDVQVFLSTPDGKSIAAFRLPYYASEQSKQIVTHWQKKHLYKDHMDEAAFSAYTKNLVQQGAMAGNEKYVTENRPTDLYLHFLPFLQGMVYVGNEAPLKEDELQLVQNLADAFSTAYARYEDFNKLELAKAELESAMTELKATQSQLVQQEKLASLGQLTAGIAHEIKNPLNFVNNFSEVSMELIEEALEEIAQIEDNEHATESAEILSDIKSNLKKIHEHGTRANGIVTSMLQHSRGGSGKKEPTDLNALIKEYVNLSFHGMRAGKNPINVDIVLDLDPEIKEVSLIKEDFTRVIINLCNNAFDALKTVKTKRAASLGVCTKKHLDTITIEIEDNGPGIPDDIKDKILQPFFTTKKGTEGTGLGLSITHDIVKAHGGELTVDSNEEVGTQFTIKIPIA